jgi:hypothetical protein
MWLSRQVVPQDMKLNCHRPIATLGKWPWDDTVENVDSQAAHPLPARLCGKIFPVDSPGH